MIHDWIKLLILIGLSLVVSVVVVLGLFLFNNETYTEDDKSTKYSSEDINTMISPVKNESEKSTNMLLKRRYRRKKPWYNHVRFKSDSRGKS